MPDANLHLLIVSSDASVNDECRSALPALPEVRSVFYQVRSFDDAQEVVRDRQPQCAIVGIDRDVHELTAFARDINAALMPVALLAPARAR
jgi:hypothetical protein